MRVTKFIFGSGNPASSLIHSFYSRSLRPDFKSVYSQGCHSSTSTLSWESEDLPITSASLFSPLLMLINMMHIAWHVDLSIPFYMTGSLVPFVPCSLNPSVEMHYYNKLLPHVESYCDWHLCFFTPTFENFQDFQGHSSIASGAAFSGSGTPHENPPWWRLHGAHHAA